MLSIIIPVESEQYLLNRCLTSLVASNSTFCPIEIIVIGNDDATKQALGFESKVAARGWRLQVITADNLDRVSALNAGDLAATWPWRAYLSDNVAISAKLLHQLCKALDGPKVRYVSVNACFDSRDFISRTYARTYYQVSSILPFMQGSRLYAVNAAGRARWDQFPNATSDDILVRLLFGPDEIVELHGSNILVDIKDIRSLARTKLQKENALKYIKKNYPDLIAAQKGKEALSPGDIISIALNNPLGFLLYCGLDLVTKSTSLVQAVR